MASKINQRPIDWAAWIIWIGLMIVIGGSGYVISRRPNSTVTVWLPLRDLPAYHLISATDIVQATVSTREAGGDAYPEGQPVVGNYTGQSIKSGQAIQRSNVIVSSDPTLTQNTVAVSIPVSPGSIFNGNLESGSKVTVWSVEADNNKTTILLQQALVLDIQKTENLPKDSDLAFVLVIAVPEDKQGDILSAAARHALGLSLRD